MEGGARMECTLGLASWFTIDAFLDDSSSNCCYVAVKEERIRSSRFSFSWSSCIIVIMFLAVGGGGGAGNNCTATGLGLVSAKHITLPVIRSFSKMKGSGREDGFESMTAEHAKQLREHDYHRSARHRRVLTTVADFPLAGNEYDIGLYYTEIGLGTPSSQYFVQVDTGSDLLWVNCKPCEHCPSNSDLQIQLRLYDPAGSSTSSNASCSSPSCNDLSIIADSPCIDQSCYYSFSYGDGSTAMGYLVKDAMTYDTVISNSSIYSASTLIVFGCGFNQSGESLTSSSRAVDGIMGFGRQSLSVVTQLATDGLTTNEFAHCLQGDTGEGGIFVIGGVEEPKLVFTDMVQNQYHYNVVLKSISVGGTVLNIPPPAFDVNPNNADTGTIFDSGTTMALLVDTAYDAFVNQLTTTVSIPAVSLSDQPDTPCFQYKNSDLSSAFPNVTLNFEGATMDLIPTNYLYRQSSVGMSTSLWCFGWQRSSTSALDGLTILGDIVLKNKLVVYDLAKQRIGWVDYDCLSSVQVSNGTGNQVINPDANGMPSDSHSRQVYHPITGLIWSVLSTYAATFL